jgi:hypothetical protein
LIGMADEKDDRASRTEPVILVLLGLVFVPVLVVHAIAVAMWGG